MKIEIKISTTENYRTQFEETVAVEVSDPENFASVRDALNTAVDLVKTQKLLLVNNDRILKIMTAQLIKDAKSEGVLEGKGNIAPSAPTYKLEAEIIELKRANRQKDCQLDGLIRGVNPEYVPNPDGTEPTDLN